MKNRFFAHPLAALFLLTIACSGVFPLQGATIDWKSPVSGDWNTAANWSPAQVPGASDTVFITNNGTYMVTVASGANFNQLRLGSASGTPTLVWSG